MRVWNSVLYCLVMIWARIVYKLARSLLHHFCFCGKYGNRSNNYLSNYSHGIKQTTNITEPIKAAVGFSLEWSHIWVDFKYEWAKLVHIIRFFISRPSTESTGTKLRKIKVLELNFIVLTPLKEVSLILKEIFMDACYSPSWFTFCGFVMNEIWALVDTIIFAKLFVFERTVIVPKHGWQGR